MTEKQLFSTAVRILGLYFAARAFILLVFNAQFVILHSERLNWDWQRHIDLITPVLYLALAIFMLKGTSHFVKFVFPPKAKD